jgi:hypothetical protein
VVFADIRGYISHFCIWYIWKVVLGVQILKFQVRETFILPHYITLLNSNLNLHFSNLYGRYLDLPLALWSLNYKIRVHIKKKLTPNHSTQVSSDLFDDEIWSKFNLSLSKIVGRYLTDFKLLALMIFYKKIKRELRSKEKERHVKKSQIRSKRKHFCMFYEYCPILVYTSIEAFEYCNTTPKKIYFPW